MSVSGLGLQVRQQLAINIDSLFRVKPQSGRKMSICCADKVRPMTTTSRRYKTDPTSGVVHIVSCCLFIVVGVDTGGINVSDGPVIRAKNTYLCCGRFAARL